MPRKRKRKKPELTVSQKANRILQVVLFALLLIGLRLWHLTVIEYDSRVATAEKPKKRTIVEPAKRASIRDRFNIPLAINQTQFQATIHYAEIADLPTISWEKTSDGKRVKHYRRREYIEELSALLGKELHLDPQRVEDLIHSKAVFYFHIPYVIKDEITEEQYYRLNMLQRDFPGLLVRRVPKRIYPLGSSASGIIGYMGAINRTEYEKILHKIHDLNRYIQAVEQGQQPEPVDGITSLSYAYQTLKDLKARSYAIDDRVGKAGIEAVLEQELRGYKGKTSYQVDAKGRFLRKLPGSKPSIPGRRVLLSMSSELQKFAETLLIQNEKIRDRRLKGLEFADDPTSPVQRPWIKGGAIVALDPNNGDILALASHPRFNPNDFIPSSDPKIHKQKQNAIIQWFETEDYLGKVWEQRLPLVRERFNLETSSIQNESLNLNWEQFLDFLLDRDHPVRKQLWAIATVGDGLDAIESIDELLYATGSRDAAALINALYSNSSSHQGLKRVLNDLKKNEPSWFSSTKETLDAAIQEIPDPFDKLLLLDLLKLYIHPKQLSLEQKNLLSNFQFPLYRQASASFATIDETTKNIAKDLYHNVHFVVWRNENEKSFLRKKRTEEKTLKKYHKPYIDHLDTEEKKQFAKFWKTHRYDLITILLTGNTPQKNTPAYLEPYLKTFTLWNEELDQGAHQATDWYKSYQILKRATVSFTAAETALFLSTIRRFEDLSLPLYGRYPHIRGQKEKDLACAFYPRYGFGFARSMAYRRACPQGSLFKLVTGYAALKHRLEKIGPSSPLSAYSPIVIDDRAHGTGREQIVANWADGTPIPRRYKGGMLTKSLMRDIGMIDMKGAIQYSSNPYFSIVAAEHLEKPEDLVKTAKQFSYGAKTGISLPGEYGGILPNDLNTNQTGLYSFAIGQHTLVATPLQAATMLATISNGGTVWRPNITHLTAGKRMWQGEDPITTVQSYPHQDSLQMAGIHFPLFSASLGKESVQKVEISPAVVRNQVEIASPIQKIISEGMDGAVQHIVTDGLWGLQRIYHDHPEAIKSLKKMSGEIMGKTGTAEALASFSLDHHGKASNVNHSWFGGISKEKDIIVVVYLRYGGYGKDAAPLAAQVIEKWHEIKKGTQTSLSPSSKE